MVTNDLYQEGLQALLETELLTKVLVHVKLFRLEGHRLSSLLQLMDTKTRLNNIVRNKSSELLFSVPENLTASSFQIEVRSIFKNYKRMRTGRLLIDLSVLS